MKYREVFYDGGNGACLGDLVDLELNEDGTVEYGDQTFSSRNDDGLLGDHDDGQTLLVPVE